jgi:hypothetical protein
VSLTAPEKRLRAQIAANARWKNTPHHVASAAARQRLLARFEAEVPENITDPAERARRADNAMREHMARLAF